MAKSTIDIELEKVEIVTRLFHLCTLEQLKDIDKCFIPKQEAIREFAKERSNG